MSQLGYLDKLTQVQRGYVSGYFGSPYSVYRVGAESNGSVFDGTPVDTVEAKMGKAPRSIVETNPMQLMIFEVEVDNRTLEFGDVLVGTSSRDLATYVYCQYRTIGQTLWLRTDKRGVIWRAPAETPTGGLVPLPVEGYDFDQVLQLVDGQYSFGTGTAAELPIGGMMGRLRDTPKSDDPVEALNDDVRRVIWDLYVPPLPGYTPALRDVISVPEGDFSIVAFQINPYGMFGNFIVGERNRG